MKQNFFHIVAASGEAKVIGQDNHLPWPKEMGDLKFFKTTTAGSTVIMGHHTFESIGSKALPGRENIVISRSNFSVPEDVILVHSINEAFEKASRDKVFIIGGAQLYQQTINQVDGIIMTKIPGEYKGNTYYPEIPSSFIPKEMKEVPGKPELKVIVYEKIKK